MKLLLHACCGPCSLEPVRLLQEAGYDLAIYYVNSNIAPAREYERRFDTLRAWAHAEGVAVLEGSYDPQAWEKSVGKIGVEALAEARGRRAAAAAADGDSGAGGAAARIPLPLAVDPSRRLSRCQACYRMRFEETAAAARQRGFDAIGTTLSISPYQYIEEVQEELERAAALFGVGAVFQDFRPHFAEAERRSREAGMYRQNYCGCRFSAAEAAAERAQRREARKAAQEAERAAHAAERAQQEAERAAKQERRRAYDEKQARKRAVLKALREKERADGQSGQGL